MVVVHSESGLIWLAFLVAIAAVLMLMLSAALALGRNFRMAKRIALMALGGLAAWVLVANAISLLTPRTIVKVGETYCWDILCLGIDEVVTAADASGAVYRLNVHIFSDANTVKLSFKGVSLYLMDERGRHFPLVHDTSVIPFDSILAPGQSIKTSLTFKAAPDVRQLFLTWAVTEPGQQSSGGEKAPFWAPLVGWVMYGGGGFLLQKQALLRVL